MKFSKLISIFICVAMLMSFASCTLGEGTSWVYEIEGEKISSGVYLLYQQQALSEAVEKIQTQEKEKSGVTTEQVTDPNLEFTVIVKNIDSYNIEEKTENENNEILYTSPRDWIKQRTLESVKEFVLLKKLQSEHQLLIPLLSIEQAISDSSGQFKQYKDSYEHYGIGQESIETVAISEARKNSIYTNLFTNSGEYAPTEDEIKTYFEDKYGYAFWLTSYTTGFSDEDIKAVEKEFDALLQKLNDGEDVAQSITEYKDFYQEYYDKYNEAQDTEDSAIKDLPEDEESEEEKDTKTPAEGISSVDDDKESEKDLEDDKDIDADDSEKDTEVKSENHIDNHSTILEKDATASALPQEVLDAIWKQEPTGKKFEKIKSENGSMNIVARRDIFSNPDNFKTYRNTIMSKMAQDNMPEIFDGISSSFSVTENTSALKKYSADELIKKLNDAYKKQEQNQQAQAQAQYQ